jgi:endonuclease/exonuclease/phosphatase family metal-dependent hydrolase
MPLIDSSNKCELRLRVVTLNLLHGAPLPGGRHARASLETRLAWTSRRLAEENPDIVLLQEASASARQENTAAVLARHLGMAYVYARANPSPLFRLAGGGRLFEEGPAVLSRLPIVGRRIHRLSSVLNLFEQLVREVEATPHAHPAIVGGDFNAEERSHEIKLLTEVEGWIDSFRHLHGDDPGYTWGQALTSATATAGSRIDFLFSVPARNERWEPCHSRLILDRAFPQTRGEVLWASDHYGVLSDFEAPSSRRNSRA